MIYQLAGFFFFFGLGPTMSCDPQGVKRSFHQAQAAVTLNNYIKYSNLFGRSLDPICFLALLRVLFLYLSYMSAFSVLQPDEYVGGPGRPRAPVMSRGRGHPKKGTGKVL
jgi:hypothetical protein